MKNVNLVLLVLIGLFNYVIITNNTVIKENTKKLTFNKEEALNYDKNNQTDLTEHHISKRFIAKLIAMQPNKNYQACLTPSGSQGHCKHIHQCELSEFKQNFWRFLDYLCIIERVAIGVCCPDEVSEKSGPSVNNLPNTGDSLPPIWGTEGNDGADTPVAEAIIARPEERGCGLATKSFPKITGGRPADPGEWPWMAALLRRGPPNAYCGGVLITDRHVLTAAHCTYKYQANEIYVRLGEYDFRTYNETRFRDFRVVDVRQHIDFDSTTYENDIAILKLHQATIFNSYIWPVCMPPSGNSWEGYRAVVTGWGTQFFGGPASDVLMEVQIPIWNQEKCRQSFTQRISNSVICAGSFSGGRDSCQGDSGGPLLVQLPNKRWITVGIVSWGMRCGEPNHPGIYTSVNAYSSWVIENSVF